MKSVRLLPPFAALLLASACGGGGITNEAANNAELTANDMAMNDALAADDVGEGAEAAPVVAAPPAPPSDLSAEEAAPLAQATQVATEIESDPQVERVPYQDGWAWRRAGQIIRTASRDGRVSYFRPGEAAPFFVQQGDRGFAYSSGRAQRAYDGRGRPSRIDDARRAAAQRAVEQSRRDRDEAQRAPRRDNDRTPNRGDDHRGADRTSPDRNAGGDRDRDHRDQADRTDRDRQRPGTRPDRDTGENDARDATNHATSDHGDHDRRRPAGRDNDDRDSNVQHPQGQ
jgi:hypothetical protein